MTKLSFRDGWITLKNSKKILAVFTMENLYNDTKFLEINRDFGEKKVVTYINKDEILKIDIV